MILTVFGSIVVANMMAGTALTVALACVRAGLREHGSLQRAIRGVRHHGH